MLYVLEDKVKVAFVAILRKNCTRNHSPIPEQLLNT